MFGSAACEVAIGLLVTYTVFGGVCSALRELVARLLSAREKSLADAVSQLLGADGSRAARDVKSNVAAFAAFSGVADNAARVGKLTKEKLASVVLGHPLIRNLAKDAKSAPSYLPARVFGTALLDVLVPDKSARTVQAVRDAVVQLPDKSVQAALLPLIDGAGDIAKLQASIERHFDDAMDRASGWYKRRTQVVIFVISCVVTVAANVDSIHLVTALWQDPAQRQELVAQATTSAGSANVSPLPSASALQTELPIGWHHLPSGDSRWDWFARFMGWLTSAIAMTMGGPFWFDVLSRFVNLRAAGPPPARATNTT